MKITVIIPTLNIGGAEKLTVNLINDWINKAHIIDGRIPHAVILETFTDSGIGTEILL